jgi:hypothetical protein
MEIILTFQDKEEPVFRLWLEGEERQSNTGSAGTDPGVSSGFDGADVSR